MILVSIIGDSIAGIAPILFEFKEKIKKHVLIYDDALYEKRKVDKLRLAIEYLNVRYSLDIEQLEAKIDEDSKKEIDALIKELYGFCEDPNDIYLNATEGPANIGILLSSEILKKDGHVIVYDNMDNTYNLLYRNGMRNIGIKNNMGVADYVNMLGMEIISYRHKADIKKNKKRIMRLFRAYGTLIKIREAILNNDKSFPYNEYAFYLKELQKIGAIDKSRNILDKNFLYGGMFEEYIYWLVKKLDFDDIMINAIIAIEHVGGASVKNEFDILLMKENHLYMIECKHKKHLNGDNIVYKYDALRDIFGPDSKAMIVNISKKKKEVYKNKKISTSFSRGNINRALVNNIDIYHESRIDEKKFLKRVEKFFNVKPKLRKRENQAPL